MLWRTVRVACVLGVLAVVAAPACGGSSSNPGTPSSNGGAGHGDGGGSGSGGKAGNVGSAGAPATMKCGTATCKGVQIPIQNFTIPPCCADEAASQCGLDSSVLAAFGPTFPVACQPLDQPGKKDDHCPMSTATPVAGTGTVISFEGCCHPDHTCGYLLDKLAGIFPLGLGCVDASPFLDGGAPQGCGDSGGASQGGAAGAAGATDSAAAGDGGAAGT